MRQQHRNDRYYVYHKTFPTGEKYATGWYVYGPMDRFRVLQLQSPFYWLRRPRAVFHLLLRSRDWYGILHTQPFASEAEARTYAKKLSLKTGVPL